MTHAKIVMILLLAINEKYGQSSQRIDGWSSLKACNEAIQMLPLDYKEYSFCVEVK